MSEEQEYIESGEVDDRFLVEQAILGKQVEAFFSSDVGRYLVARAGIERKEALLAILECDPEETAKIRNLQNKARIGESVVTWLNECIQRGIEAIDNIDERRGI